MRFRWGLIPGNYCGYIGWKDGRFYLIRLWIEFRSSAGDRARANFW